MDAAVRQFVRQRAENRCEYCRLPQERAPFFTFHVEHIHARQHAEDDTLDNLALACPDCNRHKGPNLATLDAETGELIPLFHPRRDAWEEHFAWRGPWLEGKTPAGRATIRLLRINDEQRVEVRRELALDGES